LCYFCDTKFQIQSHIPHVITTLHAWKLLFKRLSCQVGHFWRKTLVLITKVYWVCLLNNCKHSYKYTYCSFFHCLYRRLSTLNNVFIFLWLSVKARVILLVHYRFNPNGLPYKCFFFCGLQILRFFFLQILACFYFCGLYFCGLFFGQNVI
jgi:hypothetical protein